MLYAMPGTASYAKQTADDMETLDMETSAAMELEEEGSGKQKPSSPCELNFADESCLPLTDGGQYHDLQSLRISNKSPTVQSKYLHNLIIILASTR